MTLAMVGNAGYLVSGEHRRKLCICCGGVGTVMSVCMRLRCDIQQCYKMLRVYTIYYSIASPVPVNAALCCKQTITLAIPLRTFTTV